MVCDPILLDFVYRLTVDTITGSCRIQVDYHLRISGIFISADGIQASFGKSVVHKVCRGLLFNQAPHNSRDNEVWIIGL